MPRPRLGDLKILTKYQQAEKDYRTAMEQHFEALAAACFRWRAEHEHDDFLLDDHSQGMACKNGEKKC